MSLIPSVTECLSVVTDCETPERGGEKTLLISTKPLFFIFLYCLACISLSLDLFLILALLQLYLKNDANVIWVLWPFMCEVLQPEVLLMSFPTMT